MAKMRREHFLLTFMLLWQMVSGLNNLLEEIKRRPNLSQFSDIIQGNDFLKLVLEQKSYTAFIPTNEAMNTFTGLRDVRLVEYHLINNPFKIQDSLPTLTTTLQGNPKLHVTRVPSGRRSVTGWEDNDIYINNAKVIIANNKLQSKDKHTQYLHIIDEVIAPTVPLGKDRSMTTYPDAKTVLDRPAIFGFSDKFSLTSLRKRVLELNTMDIFAREGNNTFFLPVDQNMNLLSDPAKNVIDKQVIYGHIVPNEALFTRTSSDTREPFKSLVQSNSLKVFIKITKTAQPETQELVYYVESNTAQADPTHMKGVAMARIIKANIPVRNGVLHLIDRPLMVVESNIAAYLKEEYGKVSAFYDLINDYLPELKDKFVQDRPLTVFAPSNSAFKRVNPDRLRRTKANREELRKILELHIVRERLTTDELLNTPGQLYEQETMSPGRKLYFDVKNPDALIPTVTLEGAGVNASITTPNIIARNGVIHIIDRILGIPSQTVLEKLASDRTLTSTYELIVQTKWKDKFNDTSKKFTFFAPSNDAWEQINRTMASAHKKLFMGGYGYHAAQILERHLIVNEALSLDELIRLSNNDSRTYNLVEGRRQAYMQMLRDKIFFTAKLSNNFDGEGDSGDNYFLSWFSVSAKVQRPDVECVNGVVHVIDKVLMRKSDVTVSSSNKMAVGTSTLLSIFMSVILAWSLI